MTQGFLPQLHEFYFTTDGKKFLENYRCIVPNFINDSFSDLLCYWIPGRFQLVTCFLLKNKISIGSVHHGQTGASLDVGATLVGSSDERQKYRAHEWDVHVFVDRSPSGMSTCSLTALRHFESGRGFENTEQVQSITENVSPDPSDVDARRNLLLHLL
jgi:hypothetical protein